MIVLRGWVSGYGNYLCIRHKPNFSTCYAHMSSYGTYQQGQLVSHGEIIGYVGHSGVGTGAHLHFEVRLSGGAGDPAVDPVPFLKGASAVAGGSAAMAATASCGDDASGLAEGDAPVAPGPVAVLDGKILSAPSSAPQEVKKLIAAGNALQNVPYTYAGGHNAAYRPSPGFDCSATVSYVLWKAGLLKGFPLDSAALARWGRPGRGGWVTIYANAGHAFISVAGQRLDTSPHGSPQTRERAALARRATARRRVLALHRRPPARPVADDRFKGAVMNRAHPLILVALVLAFTAAGCGVSDPYNDTKDNATTATQQTPAQPPTDDPSEPSDAQPPADTRDPDAAVNDAPTKNPDAEQVAAAYGLSRPTGRGRPTDPEYDRMRHLAGGALARDLTDNPPESDQLEGIKADKQTNRSTLLASDSHSVSANEARVVVVFSELAGGHGVTDSAPRATVYRAVVKRLPHGWRVTAWSLLPS